MEITDDFSVALPRKEAYLREKRRLMSSGASLHIMRFRRRAVRREASGRAQEPL